MKPSIYQPDYRGKLRRVTKSQHRGIHFFRGGWEIIRIRKHPDHNRRRTGRTWRWRQGKSVTIYGA